MVPLPWYQRVLPETTSQSLPVLLKLRWPAFNVKTVLPAGTALLPAYFALIRNVALPVDVGLLGRAPRGEVKLPLPETDPAVGS